MMLMNFKYLYNNKFILTKLVEYYKLTPRKILYLFYGRFLHVFSSNVNIVGFL
jgi:hypothetical protein